jgi:hypothetical protein
MMTRPTKLDGCAQLPAVRRVPVPSELDMIADAVLNYRPKNKAKKLRPKKRKKAK